MIESLLTAIAIPVAFFALSLSLVGIGLLFKKPMGVRTFGNGQTMQCYELPDWLRWCQNPEDLLMGDHPRGWYWFEYMDGKPDWFKMLWWSGFRNPFNYLKRVVLGADIRTLKTRKICGDDYVRDDFDNEGFQILMGRSVLMNAKWYNSKPALYWVRRWGESDRAIVVQIGWKLKLSHNGRLEGKDIDYFKGLTFEINPAKDIS